MSKWQARLPQLKAERVLQDAEEKKMAENYRRKWIGRYFLQALRVEGEEHKVEKEKN